ncbi:YbaY family lipoprotein [Escherichia coli]
MSATQPAIQQPNVSGTVWIRQKVALPPDAVLTVTLSDASLADAPSKVLAQKAVTQRSTVAIHFVCHLTRQMFSQRAYSVECGDYRE